MKTVFLSAGHSNVDPGAVANGRREADIAVEFRNIVGFYLHREGIRFELDGAGTENLPLSRAVKMAKGHDLAVEFHCNAAANTTATGVECLSNAKQAQLAGKLSRSIAVALNLRDRGAKPENAGQHHRLAFISDAGGIIVELFFITNPADLAAYDARKWLAGREVASILAREATRG
jgi:N-acetylmuramoyl-L-alanine amidase